MTQRITHLKSPPHKIQTFLSYCGTSSCRIRMQGGDAHLRDLGMRPYPRLMLELLLQVLIRRGRGR